MPHRQQQHAKLLGSRCGHLRDVITQFVVAAVTLMLFAATSCRAEVPPWMLGDEQTMKCYFLNKTEIPTPDHIRLSWSSAPPATMYDDSTFNVSYDVEIAPAFWTSPGTAALLQSDLAHWRSLCDGAGSSQCTASSASNCCVFHSNLHSCRSNTGVCSPWVKPQNCTSGVCEQGTQLVTHTTAQVGGAEFYSHGLRLQQGSWVVIAHIKIMNFQCAVGATRTVHERPPEATAMKWVIPLVIAIVCVIVLVALTNGYQYTRGQLLTVPLRRLAERMERTASLQDDDEEDEPSALSEVADMQAAYSKMKAELNRMRSFLPQSLLQADDDDDDDEEGDAGAVRSGNNSESSATQQTANRSESASHRSSRSRQSTNSHSQSQSDTKSHRSSRQSLVGVVKKGLNTKVSVQMKRVVMCTFNLVDFRQFEQSQNVKSVSSTQSQFMGIVLRAVQANKGCVDHFVGDRVMVTFNAVNNVARAGIRASSSALAVVDEASKVRDLPGVTCGIAGGICAVGNMGTDVMMRFNVVGPAYRDALLLERFARQQLLHEEKFHAGEGSKSLIIVADSLIPDIGLEMLCEIVDVVSFGNGSFRLVAALKKAKSMASDEWMYQIKEGEDADPYVKMNQAFGAVHFGERDRATELLDEIRASGSTVFSLVAVSRLAELVAVADGESLDKHATRVPFIVSE